MNTKNERSMTRRKFIEGALVLGGGSILSGCWSSKDKTAVAGFQNIGTALGGIVRVHPEGLWRGSILDCQFAKVDFVKNEVSYLPLDFSPHALVKHPQKQNVVLAVSMPDFNGRYGYHGDYTKACLIDIEKNELIRYIRSPEDRFFYGHAVFEPESDVALFISDNYDHVAKYASRINQAALDVIDVSTGQHLDKIAVGGTIVHDACRSVDGRHVIVPRNVIGQNQINPQAVFINTKSRQIERTISFQSTDYALAHFRETPEKTVFFQAWTPIYSRQKAKLLFASPTDELFRVVEHPADVSARIQWEAPMDVCVHPTSQITAVSWTKYDFVGIYSSVTGQYINHINMPGPTGMSVSLDQKYFVVQTHGGRFRFIRIEDLQEELVLNQNSPKFEGYLIDYFKHSMIV
jgi:hypothetical protein